MRQGFVVSQHASDRQSVDYKDATKITTGIYTVIQL